MIELPKFSKSRITPGFIAEIHPSSDLAGMIAEFIVEVVPTCMWYGTISQVCGEPTVRCGIFQITNSKDKSAAAFCTLCERHKQMGQWSDAETAFGW